MNKLLIVFTLLFSSNCFAYMHTEESREAICYYMTEGYSNTKSVAISCLSRAQIERDKIELEKSKLELARLKAQIQKEDEEKARVKKNVEAAKKSPESETFSESTP